MTGDTVQQIKERLNIQDIVAPHVKLTRAGRSLVGLCPFHKEKTPSFHVSLERGSWHCFGCGLGGDGFSFIEKVEGVDFKGALRILAEKAGVTLEYRSRSSGDGEKKDRLRALVNRACEWYAGKLAGSPAEEYAKKRGLADSAISAWRLGYAPDAWRALLEALTAEGFTIPELLSVGLIKEADGKRGTYYDRFRNRLMFPIRDVAGRAVAFTGRTLEVGDRKDGVQTAKYLNSPETEFYHKSEILYGMDFARDAIRVRKFTLLVEGQVDVLHAHQAGFQNTVALSGTALSEKHLSLMKRYSENLMLVLDADSAGLTATARSAALALGHGLQVKAVRLPKGKDPADLIAEDPSGFTKRLASAKPIIIFFLLELAELESDQYRFKRLVKQFIYPLLAAIPDLTVRGHFIEETARYLSGGDSISDIRTSVHRLLKHPALVTGYSFPAAENANRPEPLSPEEVRGELLLAVVHAYRGTDLARRVESEYCRITEAGRLPSEESREHALFAAEQAFGEDPREDAADELLRAFEEAVIREAYQRAVGTLRRAEAGGDAAAVVGAQLACAKLSARLSAFGS